MERRNFFSFLNKIDQQLIPISSGGILKPSSNSKNKKDNKNK